MHEERSSNCFFVSFVLFVLFVVKKGLA